MNLDVLCSGNWNSNKRYSRNEIDLSIRLVSTHKHPPIRIRNPYSYACKAIRKNLIWNLFGQRHSLPRSHTSLSIFRPIAPDISVMDRHGIAQISEVLTEDGYIREVEGGGVAVVGWVGGRELACCRCPRRTQPVGHGERDLCHLSVDVR